MFFSLKLVEKYQVVGHGNLSEYIWSCNNFQV